MTKEEFEKLESLFSKASSGKVKQVVGRMFPKRIDLMLGDQLPDTLEEIDALRKNHEGKIINVCHMHPVSNIWREINTNSESDMDWIEALWNFGPEIIETLKEKFK